MPRAKRSTGSCEIPLFADVPKSGNWGTWDVLDFDCTCSGPRARGVSRPVRLEPLWHRPWHESSLNQPYLDDADPPTAHPRLCVRGSVYRLLLLWQGMTLRRVCHAGRLIVSPAFAYLKRGAKSFRHEPPCAYSVGLPCNQL